MGEVRAALEFREVPAAPLDFVTIPLHSPNDRNLPAVGPVQEHCQWRLKNGGKSHRSREPTMQYDTRQSDTVKGGAMSHIPLTVLLSPGLDCVSVYRTLFALASLQWRHNECIGVSNHQPRDCLHNCLFKAQIKENIKAPGTGEFPAQMASNAENVSIWWRHHVITRGEA